MLILLRITLSIVRRHTRGTRDSCHLRSELLYPAASHSVHVCRVCPGCRLYHLPLYLHTHPVLCAFYTSQYPGHYTTAPRVSHQMVRGPHRIKYVDFGGSQQQAVVCIMMLPERKTSHHYCIPYCVYAMQANVSSADNPLDWARHPAYKPGSIQ